MLSAAIAKKSEGDNRRWIDGTLSPPASPRGSERKPALEAALWAGLRDLVHPADTREVARALLAQAATQLRELAVQNDPDVIREGIAAVADMLENVAGPPPAG
jgi:hypothetical protein